MGNQGIGGGIALTGLCLSGVILVGACTTAATSPDAAGARPDAPVPVNVVKSDPAAPEIRSDITFFDADAFDGSLGQALADNPATVHVVFAAPTSLNAIPPRMNVWLTEVKKSNGRIQMQSIDPKAGPGRRGLGISMIFDIIDAVITWQERAARAKQLAGAHAYDATIVYDKNTGVAKEVLFQRRGA